MNEITRIHLAKVPYDIEITAKKQLEAYLRALEAFTDDSDWLQDIEIRITEILEERSVQRNGLITTEEINAIRAQLGEPEDFYGEGDIAVGTSGHTGETPTRRLYRDPSTAMLGGVLSGIAQYIKINPIWIRLAFIALLFVSFGTVAIVYAVLWIVLPPANSVATQLELTGEPVTLASLKSQRQKIGRSGEISPAADITRKVLLYGTGTFAAVMAAMSLIVVIWAGAGLMLGTTQNSPLGWAIPDSFNAWAAYVLFVVSGLLLGAFFSLIAVMCFKRTFVKPIRIALITIVIAGIVSFGAGVGFASYEAFQRSAALEASRTTKTVQLPEAFADIKSLTVGVAPGDEDNQNGNFSMYSNIQYIVTERAPRYEMTTDFETNKVTPVVTINEDGSAAISLKSNPRKPSGFGYQQEPYLKIYGPALESVIAQSPSFEYQTTKPQDSLKLDVKSGRMTLTGAYKNVTATVEHDTDLSAGDASIESLTISLTSGRATAGVVRNLIVTQSDVCPANSSSQSNNVLEVQAVSSERFTYNGEDRKASSFKQACGAVVIGAEEFDALEDY